MKVLSVIYVITSIQKIEILIVANLLFQHTTTPCVFFIKLFEINTEVNILLYSIKFSYDDVYRKVRIEFRWQLSDIQNTLSRFKFIIL